MKPIDAAERSLVKATAVADHLDVHRATVYKLAKNGVIPFIYVGNTIRFDLQAVLDALESNQSDSAKTQATTQSQM